jgi:hypothetical protein
MRPGHVLGIGTLWSAKGLLVGAGTTEPRLIGSQATAMYNAVYGTNADGDPSKTVADVAREARIGANPFSVAS